jgi:hypothetical protein
LTDILAQPPSQANLEKWEDGMFELGSVRDIEINSDRRVKIFYITRAEYSFLINHDPPG